MAAESKTEIIHKPDMMKIMRQTVEVEKSMRNAAKYLTGQNVLRHFINEHSISHNLKYFKLDFTNSLDWQIIIDKIAHDDLNIMNRTPEELTIAIAAWPL